MITQMENTVCYNLLLGYLLANSMSTSCNKKCSLQASYVDSCLLKQNFSDIG